MYTCDVFCLMQALLGNHEPPANLKIWYVDCYKYVGQVRHDFARCVRTIIGHEQLFGAIFVRIGHPM